MKANKLFRDYKGRYRKLQCRDCDFFRETSQYKLEGTCDKHDERKEFDNKKCEDFKPHFFTERKLEPLRKKNDTFNI